MLYFISMQFNTMTCIIILTHIIEERIKIQYHVVEISITDLLTFCIMELAGKERNNR